MTPIDVKTTSIALQMNVSIMTFFAVLYPQISASTSPSMYAKGNVIVPASNSDKFPIVMIFTAMRLAVRYSVTRMPVIATSGVKLPFRFFEGFSGTLVSMGATIPKNSRR